MVTWKGGEEGGEWERERERRKWSRQPQLGAKLGFISSELPVASFGPFSKLPVSSHLSKCPLWLVQQLLREAPRPGTRVCLPAPAWSQDMD